MLDEQTRRMLEVADQLTGEDLEYLRGSGPAAGSQVAVREPPRRKQAKPPLQERSQSTPHSRVAQGEYERQRTRESKIATVCVGSERPKHQWWPIGTELVGRIGPEVFKAVVVDNPQVKSGRSLQIMSGPVQGRICNTPTRAALEATEAHRNRYGLGRAGGVTNGWSFWQPKG